MGNLVYTQHALSPIGSGPTDHALPYLIQETQGLQDNRTKCILLDVSTHSQLCL